MQYRGSRENGRWDTSRTEKEGTYEFANGTVYKGSFRNGAFHGKGTLIFRNAGQYLAEWKDGVEVEGSGKYVFRDGLHYSDHNWKYCTQSDRRFNVEIEDEASGGVAPAGKTRLTNHGNTIPRGCYDVGDGYVDPNAGIDAVRNYTSGKVIRAVQEAERRWMVERCYRPM